MAQQIVWAHWGLLDGVIQRDASVCVEDGTIVECATKASLTRKYPGASLYGGDHLCLLPGLINSHDHGRALGTTSLGIPDEVLEEWIANLGAVPQLPPRLAMQFEGLQLIKSGVTATNHSHNAARYDAIFDEVRAASAGYRDAGIRVAIYPPLMDQNRLIYDDRAKFVNGLPRELQHAADGAMALSGVSHDDFFAQLDDLYAELHDAANHLVHIQVSPVGGQWASDELMQRSAAWAREKQTRMQMHMLESPYQRCYSWRKWNKGFVQHLHDIEVLGEWLTLAHMIWTEPDDAALLVETDTSIAHNPSSNLRLRSGVAPIASYRAAGIKIGIGMDGHTLDDDQDYLREMRMAYTLGNRPSASALDISPLDVFDMATSQGARVNFGDTAPLGVLKAGYLADLVLVDWGAVQGSWCPPSFPADEHLPEFFIRRATRRHVRHVMIHGDWVLKDGRHTKLDEDELNREVQAEYARQAPPTLSPLGPYVRSFYADWDEE